MRVISWLNPPWRRSEASVVLRGHVANLWGWGLGWALGSQRAPVRTMVCLQMKPFGLFCSVLLGAAVLGAGLARGTLPGAGGQSRCCADELGLWGEWWFTLRVCAWAGCGDVVCQDKVSIFPWACLKLPYAPWPILYCFPSSERCLKTSHWNPSVEI